MEKLPNCPKCDSEYTYEDGNNFVCPMCSYEWSKDEIVAEDEDLIKDVNGAVLQDGDSVIVIKDLKVKGSSNVIKKGTKAKSIRVILGKKDHNIDTKLDGFGAIELTAIYVKKA
ncbi:zinc ribbon domain-containing protein YjdM [Mycoplasma sp. P36-A1]|uniref:zinc ribbon domain-containing protein YjdM n=1 Tax=Mycoplasma sp. P36-A1 TaxID=3252900 RepID=UPI003C2AADFB